MVRYKMLGKDGNSNPTQYRTWVVDDAPDFTGELYTGLKSGDTPLINISAYQIDDPFAVVDFNLPNPLDWSAAERILPDAISSSQLAVVDGYVYLFGGQLTDAIYRAPLNNPANWENTGSVLPVPLYGSQLAIIDDTIYLFGGHKGTSITNTIYSASVDDPLTWSEAGGTIPRAVHYSHLVILDDFIYMFGGSGNFGATNSIFRASIDDPLSWIELGSILPASLSNSHATVIGSSLYMFGGIDERGGVNNTILKANVSDPATWSIDMAQLPYGLFDGQFFTIASKGYLIAPTVSSGSPLVSFTRILSCNLSSPTVWTDTGETVPGEVSQSQLAIIDDRLFLFGGNGNSAIFVDNPILKYKPDDATAVSYGDITRTQFNATAQNDLFQVLGFGFWKTDYGS